MIKGSQLSIYGLTLINGMLANRFYPVSRNTTLNEKFNILPDQHMPKGSVDTPIFPRVKYFTIGIGGNRIIEKAEGYKMSQHRVLDAALFHHIPFVLKKPNEDITPERRLDYRLRKLINVNGESYYAYYAKVVQLKDFRPYNFLITRQDGKDVISMLNMDTDEYLNPVPFNKPTDKNEVLNMDTVINRFKFEFLLTQKEQDDLREVIEILMLPKDTRITEIGICHGYDTIVGDGYESLDTQITYFVDVDLDVATELDGKTLFQRNIELGGSEPFFR